MLAAADNGAACAEILPPAQNSASSSKAWARAQEDDEGFPVSLHSASDWRQDLRHHTGLVFLVYERVKGFLLRSRIVRAFLRAIKEGNAMKTLDLLARHPFLLTYRSFAGDGDTVWHLLAEFGDIDLLQTLINFCKIHKHCISGSTKPKATAAGDSPDSGRDLRLQALVNVGNDLRQTPLMFAAYHGRSEVITFLLQQGANPWSRDRCGKRTALHYACMKGHAACVRSLLEGVGHTSIDRDKDGGRYVDIKSASGFSPLHYAVASNCVPAAKELLAFDASIDSVNKFDAGEFWVSCCSGSTALHIAAAANRLHCASAILQHYARNWQRLDLQDPRALLNAEEKLPWHIARDKGHCELAKALMPGADVQMTGSELGPHGLGVTRLQVLAANVVKAQLLASIQEAEEFMKLLGTYQQHGRVFARVAYEGMEGAGAAKEGSPSGELTYRQEGRVFEHVPNEGDKLTAVQPPPALPGTSAFDTYTHKSVEPGDDQLNAMRPYGSYGTYGHNWSKVLALGGSISSSLTPSRLSPSLHAPSMRHSMRYRQDSEGESRGTEGGQRGGSGPLGGGGAGAGAAASKQRRQQVLKQWLSYERRAAAAGRRPARRAAALQERSALSQLTPDDEERQLPCCLGGCLAALRLAPRPRYLPPRAGEGVCSMCQDNKPFLEMQGCGHRACLLCAKSLCYLLDLQQLLLCPFCGALVLAFQLA